MLFKKITVSLRDGHPSNDVIGRMDYDTVAEFHNCSLTTIFEEKTNTGENELWILDETGITTLLAIHDVRFVGMWAKIMRFSGYLPQNYKKFKRNTRVDVFVWNE